LCGQDCTKTNSKELNDSTIPITYCYYLYIPTPAVGVNQLRNPLYLQWVSVLSPPLSASRPSLAHNPFTHSTDGRCRHAPIGQKQIKPVYASQTERLPGGHKIGRQIGLACLSARLRVSATALTARYDRPASVDR
jgi:hypothetical protein